MSMRESFGHQPDPSERQTEDAQARIAHRLATLAHEGRLEMSLEQHAESAMDAIEAYRGMLVKCRQEAERRAHIPESDMALLRSALESGTLKPRAATDVEAVLDEGSLRADAVDMMDEYLDWMGVLKSCEDGVDQATREKISRGDSERRAFIKEQMGFWKYAGKA